MQAQRPSPLTRESQVPPRLLLRPFKASRAPSHSHPPSPQQEAASPTSVTVLAGATGISTITVAPLQGFTGTVALTSSVSPAGLTCTLSPTSIVLGASQTSTLSCSSATSATYTVTVTGTSGSLTHTATVTFTVQDFTVSASPTAVTTTVGTAASSTITVAPVNGFTGTVALASSVSPAHRNGNLHCNRLHRDCITSKYHD